MQFTAYVMRSMVSLPPTPQESTLIDHAKFFEMITPDLGLTEKRSLLETSIKAVDLTQKNRLLLLNFGRGVVLSGSIFLAVVVGASGGGAALLALKVLGMAYLGYFALEAVETSGKFGVTLTTGSTLLGWKFSSSVIALMGPPAAACLIVGTIASTVLLQYVGERNLPKVQAKLTTAKNDLYSVIKTNKSTIGEAIGTFITSKSASLKVAEKALADPLAPESANMCKERQNQLNNVYLIQSDLRKATEALSFLHAGSEEGGQ